MSIRLNIPALTLAAAVACGGANAATLHALTSDGTLVTIDSTQRQAGRGVRVTGAPGPVLAIALRPADGKLYGLTSGQVVTIDPSTGAATPGAKLDKPFTGARLAANFNPTVDRLRVVGLDGSNARIHVDTGAVTTDAGLKYAPGSNLSATSPMVTAAAYTNHMAGAKETALYTIDTVLGQINLQAPPNDGVQQPKMQLDASIPRTLGFDILADGQGGNTGYVLASGRLWTLSVSDFGVRDLGPVQGLTADVVSLAVSK